VLDIKEDTVTAQVRALFELFDIADLPQGHAHRDRSRLGPVCAS